MIAGAPCNERYFIHRSKIRSIVRFVENKSCERSCECGKTPNEFGPEDIKIIGPAIMAKIPNHLNARIPGSMNHRQHAGPVVTVRLRFDQVPADAVASCVDADAFQSLVIQLRVCIMRSGTD